MLKLLLVSLLSLVSVVTAYTAPRRTSCGIATSRRTFIKTSTIIAPATLLQSSITTSKPVLAFDGAGSSAYTGKSTTSRAELKKSYQRRVVADVKDFKRLGNAIQNGKSDGDEWVNFFIEYKRREPDSNGRAYAAYVDLVGNKELSGCGTLLGASYAKAGKPSENLPQVKKYNAMAKTFVKAAGAKGGVAKAKAAYEKVGTYIIQYKVGSTNVSFADES